MSALFIAGERISTFVEKGDGAIGIWLCKSRERANDLQQSIEARLQHKVPKSGKPRPVLRCHCNTHSNVLEDKIAAPIVYFILVCELFVNKPDIEVTQDISPEK